ncbi:MAG TPA: helix-turn-helix domain-containing protein, partial [Deltaproteobacteria bacterium]|nr:helix-turn-helix domain-containing protein [Deltaproteobacteria bacterium]
MSPRQRIPSEEGNVRERILKASRDIFGRYAFKAASTRMVAKQAGVEHPMIHHYFGSKEKLFETMASEMY